MRSGKFGMVGALLASAAIGPMTAAERSKGRYMRAPDHDADTAAFKEFEAAGNVEVGENADAPKPRGGGSGRPPRTARAAERSETADAPGTEKTKGGEEVETNTPADDDDDNEDQGGEDQDNEDQGGDDEGEEGEQKPKPRQKASDRIRDLNRRLRESERGRTALEGRIAALEKGGLPAGNAGGKSDDIGEAPDPTDAAKYPLGHLDERYVEDRIDYLVKKKAGESADAVLQRQQETERAAEATKAHEALLGKVDDLATRGQEIYDDFQEAVIDTGLRGDWRLSQPTFEAAHEVEHGAQILYELSQDKKEAARVAGLSTFGQSKFVMDRNAEIAAKAKPRTKPGAGAPPQTQTRGANSRTSIKPDTDNLDDFEKAWKNA